MGLAVKVYIRKVEWKSKDLAYICNFFQIVKIINKVSKTNEIFLQNLSPDSLIVIPNIDSY